MKAERDRARTRQAALGALAAALAIALVLSLAAAARPGSPSAGADRPAAASLSRRLLHNGDSLAVGTQPYLRQALPGWRITASLDISRHAPEGPRIMRRYGRGLPRVIVVSLGTNDDPRALGTFRRAIVDTMRVAGRRRCVVWANVVRPSLAGTSYAGMNRVLGEEARRRPNLRVFQWARMARANRRWFGPDGVHPSGVGYRARAQGIAKIVRACR